MRFISKNTFLQLTEDSEKPVKRKGRGLNWYVTGDEWFEGGLEIEALFQK